MKEAVKKNNTVLGTYTGKCCDSNVFNNNDMHLSRELFERLMDSEEFKRALENRHYIGYAGHPEDPDCQDFQNACIVMTDMRILDNGEIEGDFDLVDTPVGKIVKAFIDAGVNFGISIRGLGDVDGNGEVDPEQFVFRGFDLVTFPAYDDCIPEFKAIAASTDAKKKAAYKKVCASIKNNLQSITSSNALEVIQEQLTEGSDPFNEVQDRIDSLSNGEETFVEATLDEAEAIELAEEKLEAVTELYLDAEERVRELEQDLATAQTENSDLLIECKTAKNRYAHLRKIAASQIKTAQRDCEDLESRNSRLVDRIHSTRSSLKTVQSSYSATKKELEETKGQVSAQIKANTKLKNQIKALKEDRNSDRKSIEASNNLNLKYQRKIEANSEAISQKDSAIEDLKTQLHETVVARKKLESEASNLDDKCNELLSRVEAAEEMVLSYQQAYANMYANALGVYLPELPVTASTTVNDLKEMIKAGTSTANIAASPSVYDADQEVDEEIDETDDLFDDEATYSAGMVTL